MIELDIQGWADLLVHPWETFTAEDIQRRAEELGHTPERVEIFTWLLEVASQLTMLAEVDADSEGNLILRGGTTSQIRVGDDRARTSADVDGFFHGDEQAISELFAQFNDKMKRCAPFLQFEASPRTEKPLKKFTAWRAFVPRLHGSPRPEGAADPGRALLVELHLLDPDEEPPNERLRGAVFGVSIDSQALTFGALLGDKLDCLAVGEPIAIDRPAYEKHARHLYDLTMLCETGSIDEHVLNDAVQGVEFFVGRHSGLEGYENRGVAKTMAAAREFLCEWGWPGGAGSKLDDHLTKAQSFQQNAPVSQRADAVGWRIRALKAALLAQAIEDAVADPETAAASYHERLALGDPDSKAPAALIPQVVEALITQGGAPSARKQFKQQLLPNRAGPKYHQRLALFAVLMLGDDACRQASP